MRSKRLIRKIKYAFFVFLSGQIVAQAGIVLDSSRVFQEAEMQAYKNLPEFAYMNYTVRPPSIWERLSWWFQWLMYELFSNPNTPWVMRGVYYLVILAVLGGIVYYFVRLRYAGSWTSESKQFAKSTLGQLPDESLDLPALINQARLDKNYALTIRYQYLYMLIQLHEKGHIKLKDWKSPYDYSKELPSEYSHAYMQLARLFEYVWYGEFPAEEHHLQQSEALINQIRGDTV